MASAHEMHEASKSSRGRPTLFTGDTERGGLLNLPVQPGLIWETRCSDAISAGGTNPSFFEDLGEGRHGRRLFDARSREVDVSPAAAFAPIRRIGGSTGWYAFDGLWRIRGFIDLLLGGVGLRRGRPATEVPAIGDRLDWWRVEAYEPDRLLRLRAEMKVPGRAWLEFEVEPSDRGAIIKQTAIFDPAGVLGPLYWYGIYPLHGIVFKGMLDGIEEAARAEHVSRTKQREEARR